MPAVLTSETRNVATVAAAHRRGVTSRCTGLTAMTSMAAISSRILREPRSAVIAEPPAPAMSSAVATGEASRTMASTIAAPVVDSAPSWRENVPTCSAITAPNGIEISTAGRLHTFAMNQHWRRYSFHQCFRSHVRRTPSREIANRFPVSRTMNCTLPSTCPSDRHDLVAGGALRLEPLRLTFDELALDLALLGRHLVHPDRALGSAREELADDLIVAVDHLLLRAEAHEAGAEQDADVVRDAHHGRDVVGDDEEGGAHLLLDLAGELVEVGDAHRVEPRVRLVEEHDLGVHDEGAGQAGALAHPARHLARELLEVVEHPHHLQLREGDLADLLLGLVRVLAQREGRVVVHVHRPEQCAVLEEDAELAAHAVE